MKKIQRRSDTAIGKSGNTVSNSILYLVEIAANSLLPLIAIPIITHKLGPAEYGVYALSQVYATVAVGITNLGMNIGYERDFFLYEKNSRQSGALLNSVTTFVAWNVGMLILFVWLWNEAISEAIFGQQIHGEMLFCVMTGTGLTSLANYYLTYLKNKGLAAEYIKLSIMKGVANFLFVLLFLLYFDLSVIALAYAFLVSSAILFVIVAWRQFSQLPFSLHKLMLWNALKIALPLTPRIFFGFLATQFDKIMLGMMSTIGGVGVYSIGQKISYLIFQFMTALDRVFIPEVYRQLFSQDKKDEYCSLGQYLLPFAYVSILIALIFALFSEEMFVLLLPKSYGGGVDIVVILSVYFASMFFGKVTGTQLIYAKKTHITTLLTLVGIAFNVLLNIPMIIHWGAIGAAWATMIAGVITNILFYRVAQRYAPVDWEWASMVWIYATYLLAVAAILTSRVYFGEEIHWEFIAVKFMFLGAYLYTGFKIGVVTPKNLRTLYWVTTGMLARGRAIR